MPRQGLADLPPVPDEVDGIAYLLGHSEILLNEEVSRAALAASAVRAGVLQIASHAQFSSVFPFPSVLLLGEDSLSGDSGPCIFTNCNSGTSRVELVVLSGHDTGRETLVGGEGSTSL